MRLKPSRNRQTVRIALFDFIDQTSSVCSASLRSIVVVFVLLPACLGLQQALGSWFKIAGNARASKRRDWRTADP